MKLEDLVTKQDLHTLEQKLLDAISKKQLSNSPSEKWLKAYEVKEMLKISSGTLQNLRISGKLSFSKIGGLTFYKESDVLELLNNNKKTF